ncbi:ArnT family glycosyltransferase [Aurantiacibacter poecillastricola]|uniref:ArnT family glycosyltransferase n=1 Tax=Aurantiacibacter poecillastricola TaxID=3064385 RepID=UPI00273DBB16|nr:glycosyltransferase family 39 protein [Aurantiacibacter sp. 219JJ12-13]MDP5262595.1 glycosyltransferase family 39 protein [Aurantiacibacter sp. 219JJ12-13]
MTSVAAANFQNGKTRETAAILRSDAACLCALAIFVVLTRLPWFGDPVADYDEQLYSFMGWRMQFGELPFVDWWDRKPFGLFAIFGIIHALFGPSALAYQLTATAFALATAGLTYHLSRKLVDPVGAAMAGALSAMLLVAYASYSAQSEVFFAPLMLGMVALLADGHNPNFTRRALLAMALGGLALQVKYTVLPQCAFLGCWALWTEYRRGRSRGSLATLAFFYAVLGLLPTLAVGIFYAAIGEFEAFWFANFVSFFDRAAAPQGRWGADHAIGVAPLVVLALGGLYAAFRMRRPEPFGTWLFFAGWAISTLAGVLLPGTVYLYHYAALAAPAALVALPLLDGRGPLGPWPGAILSVGFLLLLQLPERHASSQERRDAVDTLAAAIAPHVDRNQDCLWIWDGPTVLYRLTDSCVPTRYVYPDHLNNTLETGALGVDQVAEIDRILSGRPGAIVTADKGVTIRNPVAAERVARALERTYEPRAVATIHGRELTAWTRRTD